MKKGGLLYKVAKLFSLAICALLTVDLIQIVFYLFNGSIDLGSEIRGYDLCDYTNCYSHYPVWFYLPFSFALAAGFLSFFIWHYEKRWWEYNADEHNLESVAIILIGVVIVVTLTPRLLSGVSRIL